MISSLQVQGLFNNPQLMRYPQSFPQFPDNNRRSVIFADFIPFGKKATRVQQIFISGPKTKFIADVFTNSRMKDA